MRERVDKIDGGRVGVVRRDEASVFASAGVRSGWVTETVLGKFWCGRARQRINARSRGGATEERADRGGDCELLVVNSTRRVEGRAASIGTRVGRSSCPRGRRGDETNASEVLSADDVEGVGSYVRTFVTKTLVPHGA